MFAFFGLRPSFILVAPFPSIIFFNVMDSCADMLILLYDLYKFYKGHIIK